MNQLKALIKLSEEPNIPKENVHLTIQGFLFSQAKPFTEINSAEPQNHVDEILGIPHTISK